MMGQPHTLLMESTMKAFSKLAMKTGKTLVLPVGMFLIFLILTRALGVNYYGTKVMWLTIVNTTCYSATVALGIALQIRAGRFDFSGGITFILAAIIGGRLSADNKWSPWAMLAICVFAAVIISLITGIVYIYAKLPVVICTIGLTLLYEALTLVIFKGEGVQIISKSSLTIFGRYPWIILILVLAVMIYYFFTERSVAGYQSRHLANNQQAAVNIGIREGRNILLTYLVAGVIFGLAAAIYVSQNRVMPQSNLSTAGILFANIVSVYIGLFLSRFTNQTFGVLAAALTVSFFQYGLNAIGLKGGWGMILFAVVFMLGFNSIMINFDRIKNALGKGTLPKIS